MKNAFRRIQMLANIAIILIAILLSVITIKQFTGSTDAADTSAGPRRIPATAAEPNPNPNAVAEKISPVGKSIQVEGLDLQNKKSLVLYLSTKCRYCTESAPFYKRLIDENKSKGIKVVAILPQSVEESREYLEQNGVKIDEIKQSSSLQSIGVRSTPTLLLTNESGVVTDSWVGKLRPDREEQVIGKLFQ
jgi:thioredoxin-related protein